MHIDVAWLGQVDYLAAWEQQPDGITSLEAFTEYLTRVVECLNHPFLVETIASR